MTGPCARAARAPAPSASAALGGGWGYGSGRIDPGRPRRNRREGVAAPYSSFRSWKGLRLVQYCYEPQREKRILMPW